MGGGRGGQTTACCTLRPADAHFFNLHARPVLQNKKGSERRHLLKVNYAVSVTGTPFLLVMLEALQRLVMTPLESERHDSGALNTSSPV